MNAFTRLRRAVCPTLRLAGCALLFAGGPVRAQVPGFETEPDTVRALPNIELTTVDVLPSTVDTKGWLLLDKDIQLELGGAVHNLYDFKFDKADRQFRSLRRRYPDHPMPYFLLGLSTWWKIMPSNTYATEYDKRFFAYFDTAIVKAQRLYDGDNQNYEASFFLSAAYGFDARLHAERRDWRQATVSSKRALTYLQKSRQANGLSPEFAFGEALFNYYADWVAGEYPWLRPVLLFFPKGNRALGLAQLGTAAREGFYTGTEARFFQMRILASDQEKRVAEAMQTSRTLTREFPDNACFARSYANHTFTEGEWAECERTSREILTKLNQGMPGYEGTSGRAATYYLGYLMEERHHDPGRAQDYYRRCLVFSESVNQAKGGYYLFALANLGRIAGTQRNVVDARRYFEQVLALASRKSPLYRDARTYLRQHPATAPVNSGRSAVSPSKLVLGTR